MSIEIVANAGLSLFTALIFTFASTGFQRLFRLVLGWKWNIVLALVVFTIMFLVITANQRSSQMSKQGEPCYHKPEQSHS